jgi:hypothetical protein
MRPLPLTRPAPADLPPLRCPDCDHVVVAVAGSVTRCACGVDVADAFHDARGRRLPVRAVFSTRTERPCAACGGNRRRVLIGEDVGIACDGCGVLVRQPPRRQELARPASRGGLVAELLVLGGAVGLVAATIAWLHAVTAG